MELWLVFGAVVIGNRTLNVMMQNKYGATPNPNQTWTGGVMNQATDPGTIPTTVAATTTTVTTNISANK